MSPLDLLRELSFYSLRICLVVGVGMALPRLLRMRTPRLRLRYWYGLLSLVFFLPLVPTWQLPSPPSVAPSLASSPVEILPLVSPVVSDGPTLGNQLATAALAAVGLGVLVRWSWIGLGMIGLISIRREARPIGWPASSSRLEALGRRAQLLVTPRVATPVTFGFRRPTILLPEAFDQLSPEGQEAVLYHELVHIARRDWLWVLFEEGTRSLLWFHPVVWALLARIALAREQVVDQEVVRFTNRRRVYLEALFEFVQDSLPRVRQRLATTFIHQNDLEQRVHALLEEASMSRSHLRFAISTSFLFLLVSAVGAGFAFPLHWAEVRGSEGNGETRVADVESAAEGPIHVEGDVEAPTKVHGPAPVYTPAARDARIQGVAILRVIIDRQGKITDVEVLKGLPMGLSESAIDAVRDWEFTPAMRNGEPVEVYYNLTVNFRLSEDGKDRDAVAARERRLVSPPATSTAEPPVLQYSSPAAYTERAREAGLEGRVKLQLRIDTQGAVTDVIVLEGLPMGLSEAAVVAAYDWKFLPATVDGTPIVYSMPVTVEFER